MYIRFIFLLTALLGITGCEYNGDGVFIKEGIWPFINYSLELPPFDLVSGSEYSYHVGNISTYSRILVFLYIESSNEISFDDLNPVIAITVSQEKLTDTFEIAKLQVISHFQKMNFASKALSPEADEWQCQFRWSNENIQTGPVPYTPKKPDPMNQLMCWKGFWRQENANINGGLPESNFEMRIKCINCEDEFNLRGKIHIVSGWK